MLRPALRDALQHGAAQQEDAQHPRERELEPRVERLHGIEGQDDQGGGGDHGEHGGGALQQHGHQPQPHHDPGAHGGGGGADERQVQPHQEERSPGEGDGGEAEDAPQEEEDAGDERDVAPGDGEEVHQPRLREAVAELPVQPLAPPEHERVRERRVPPEHPPQVRLGAPAEREERVRGEARRRAHGGLARLEGAGEGGVGGPRTGDHGRVEAPPAPGELHPGPRAQRRRPAREPHPRLPPAPCDGAPPGADLLHLQRDQRVADAGVAGDEPGVGGEDAAHDQPRAVREAGPAVGLRRGAPGGAQPRTGERERRQQERGPEAVARRGRRGPPAHEREQEDGARAGGGEERASPEAEPREEAGEEGEEGEDEREGEVGHGREHACELSQTALWPGE